MSRIIAIVSAKGGVGKSSVCVGLGRAFADRELSVLLVDNDIALRSLDIMLGVGEKAVFDWGDVLRQSAALGKALLHVSDRLSLLCAPSADCAEFDCESYCDMINTAAESFDIVILDAPAGLDKGFSLCISAADEVLVIATPDEVSISAASKAADRVREAGIDRCRLIINRFSRRQSRCTIDSVIDGTAVRLIGVVPEDRRVSSVAGYNSEGLSKSAFAFNRISGRMLGENIPLRIKGM